MTAYRPEIDGLRTLAVLPVLLFHAGFKIFSGGYVGVDVFFVISGYLITSIILTDLEKNRFSIITFYERRARRILPALFLVMLSCLPFALLWLPPQEFKDFSQSLAAVSLFSSNFLFWIESGYFAVESEEKPLLHTWSLAVEEQYYVVFPLLLLALWRFGLAFCFYTILGLAALSLAFSEWGWRNMPEANFYLAPSRVWELFAGSLCAFALASRPAQPNNLLSLIGLCAIGTSIFFYDSSTPFPSLYTVLPVGGTVLIILFGAPGSWAQKLLAARPMVAIGLISYSAYLWHQPLFAFARVRSIELPSLWTMTGLLLASLALAYLSWRYVEAPFRHHSDRRSSITRSQIFTVSAIGLIGFMGLGSLGHFKPVQPFSDQKKAYLDTALANPKRSRCHASDRNPIPPEKVCVYNEGPAQIAVLGDSHAAELALGLARILEDQGRAVAHFSYSACGPTRDPSVDGTKCVTWTNEAITWILANDDIVDVVVSYRMNQHLNGKHENVYPALPVSDDPTKAAKVTQGLLHRLQALLATKNVIFVHQAPELPIRMPRLILRFGGSSTPLPGVSRAWWNARNAEMKQLFSTPIDGLTVIDPADLFCDTAQCYAGKGGVSFYFDDDHMSVAGAQRLSERIVKALQPLTQ